MKKAIGMYPFQRMRFSFKLENSWPPNAWLAVCEPGTNTVHVLHGAQVETADDWYCEAVWNGPYEAGNLDQTDSVFGSGGRLRNGSAVFVSSSSTVDRLQFSHTDNKFYVSNSIVCLVALLKITFDPCYAGYYSDFRTITKGIRGYKRTVLTKEGNLGLCYFQNLRWDGISIVYLDKPHANRDFSSFGSYTNFMRSTVVDLVENGKDPKRKHSYETHGTVSSGYDSPAVTVLAAAANNKKAFTFAEARGGKNDSGRSIAQRLGLECSIIARDAWQAHEFAEVLFLAANAYGEEVHYTGAGAAISGCMLLTGCYGGTVWGKSTDSLGPEILRQDPAGLSLTEYRLWRGFLHCPVPFLGVRQIGDINAISNSESMRAWDVDGKYSKPIPRRIVEEAGIPREWFGQEKKATSVVMWKDSEAFLSNASREDYRVWLNRFTLEFIRRRELPPSFIDCIWPSLRWGANWLPASVAATGRKHIRGMNYLMDGRVPLFYFLFPWAMSRAIATYRH